MAIQPTTTLQAGLLGLPDDALELIGAGVGPLGIAALRNVSRAARLIFGRPNIFVTCCEPSKDTSDEGVIQFLQQVPRDFPETKIFALESNRITDGALENMPNLRTLPHLQFLFLDNCNQITAQALSQLRFLPELQCLRISRCRNISDEGLLHLHFIPKLKRLQLRLRDDYENGRPLSQKITNQGLSHLGRTTQLEYVMLSGLTNISDAGLSFLQHLPECQLFILDYCPNINGAGLTHLQTLPKLIYLEIKHCDLVKNLSILQNLPQLLSLKINACREVSNADLANVQHLSQLEQLALVDLTGGDRRDLDDDGLAFLPQLKKLKEFTLHHCFCITGDFLVHLLGLTQLETLRIAGDSLRDDNLLHLEHMPQLKFLEIGKTYQITPKRISELQRRRPDLIIHKHNRYDMYSN